MGIQVWFLSSVDVVTGWIADRNNSCKDWLESENIWIFCLVYIGLMVSFY